MSVGRRSPFGGAPNTGTNIGTTGGTTSINMVPAAGGNPGTFAFDPAYISGYISFKWGGTQQMTLSRVDVGGQNTLVFDSQTGSIIFETSGANQTVTFQATGTNGIASLGGVGGAYIAVGPLGLNVVDYTTFAEVATLVSGGDFALNPGTNKKIALKWNATERGRFRYGTDAFSIGFTGVNLDAVTSNDNLTFTAPGQFGGVNFFAGDGTHAGYGGINFAAGVFSMYDGALNTMSFLQPSGWSFNVLMDGFSTGTASSSPPIRYAQTDKVFSDAVDYTLTAAEQSHPVQFYTGTTGGSKNVLAVPFTGAQYRIHNGTSANIVFKKSGGTGVTIANGKCAIVAANSAATDFVRVTGDA